MKRTAIALLASSLLAVSLPAMAAPSSCVVTASAPKTAVLGTSIRVEGKAASCASRSVTVQVQEGSKWSDVATGTSGASDRAFAITVPDKGTTLGNVTYRAVVKEGTRVVSSSNFQVKRTASVSALAAASRPVGVGANTWGKVSGGSKVPVWTEVHLPSGWARSQSGTTDASGKFVLPLTYGVNQVGSYEYRVVAATSAGRIYSSSFTLRRTASVSASAAASRPVGVGANTWGQVSGGSKVPVWTEVRLSSGWARSQSGTTDASGKFVLPLTYGVNQVGSYEYRVVAATSAGRIYSSSFTLRRTTSVSASAAASRPVGTNTNTWGRVPGVSRAQVWTEVRLSSGWARSQSGTTDASGNFVLPLTHGRDAVGVYEYRVGADTAAGRVYSAPFKLARTALPATQTFRPDARCMTGRVFCASKSQRKMAFMIDGRVLEVFEVRFGRPGYETRNGKHRIYWKNADHVSSIYNAPMPYSMFFYGGQAIHYSAEFNRIGYTGGSHGCINVRPLSAAKHLFELGRVGDWVVVYN